jgi:hypothetical protein
MTVAHTQKVSHHTISCGRFNVGINNTGGNAILSFLVRMSLAEEIENRVVVLQYRRYGLKRRDVKKRQSNDID